MKVNIFTQLLTLIPKEAATNLFVLDENCSANDIAELNSRIAQRQDCALITNRFDLGIIATSLGLQCKFNDFDFSEISENSLDNLFFRVSKERAVVHHILNQAARILRQGGHLHLCGAKQEGIKTYIKNAGLLLGDAVRARKEGSCYLASIANKAGQLKLLDDKQYPVIRAIAQLDGKPVFSKPGLFGWEKIDQGSAMLAEQLPAFLEGLPAMPAILDLGCGYGYLSIMVHKLGVSEIIATDNNAAAMLCCQKNLAERNINGVVVADDCAAGINTLFDAVICHPPFHQGFEVADDLVEKFIRSASQHLKPNGKALFVANSFVPLERLAQGRFSGVQMLVNNGQFKVVIMKKG